MLFEDVVLGDVYKDTITGIIGTAMCKAEYLSGRHVIEIQPTSQDNKTLIQGIYIDVGTLVDYS